MIVRILSEGQWVVADDALPELNELDSELETAVTNGDQQALTKVLTTLLERVRTIGEAVPDEVLAESDLILPDADASLDEVRALLADSPGGLVPD